MSPGNERYHLGTVAASEALLQDLYVDLRRSLKNWSAVTLQTPQARMGYVGQHLTSVVTGHRGGRSGARGKDLVLDDGGHAEIKTCYRVDQLGKCNECGAAVASIEPHCPDPECGSQDIKRNDDSKWLIGVRHDEEMRILFEPRTYYLVLFDFVDLDRALKVNARIFQVDPKWPGFSYCMVDYYFNIKTNSRSGAPFNLWPFELKFDIMLPELIYHAVIDENDDIETKVFPGEVGTPERFGPKPLPAYSRSKNLDLDAIRTVAAELGVPIPSRGKKIDLLEHVERYRRSNGIDDERVARALTMGLYRERVSSHREWLPDGD